MNNRQRGGYKGVFKRVMDQMSNVPVLNLDSLIIEFMATHSRARLADVRSFIEGKIGVVPQQDAKAPDYVVPDHIKLSMRLRRAERLLIEFKNEIEFWLTTCDDKDVCQSFPNWKQLLVKTNEHFKRVATKGVFNGR